MSKIEVVPELRFSGFNKAWTEKRLKEIGTFLGGGTPSKTNPDFWTGLIPWVSSSDITDDSIHQIKVTRFITEDAIAKSATKLVPENTILLVSRVGVGKLAVTTKTLCTSQDFANFTPSEGDVYFLAYYLKSKSTEFLKFNQGMAIQGFTKDDISNFVLYIPQDLEEQQKVADCLSSMDNLITENVKKLESLKLHKKGLMQKLFPTEGRDVPELRLIGFDKSWETKKFSTYIKLFRGSSPRPISEYITKSNLGVNWIKIGDTSQVSDFIIRSVSQRITPDGASKSRYVKKGELILANSMSYGSTYQLDIDGYIYDGWFVLREYEDFFDKQYLLQVLNSNYIQEQYKKLAAGGIVQNISSDIVNSVVVPKPTIEEQKKIADILNSIDDLIKFESVKIETLKKYKLGLMQRLFPSFKELAI